MSVSAIAHLFMLITVLLPKIPLQAERSGVSEALTQSHWSDRANFVPAKTGTKDNP